LAGRMSLPPSAVEAASRATRLSYQPRRQSFTSATLVNESVAGDAGIITFQPMVASTFQEDLESTRPVRPTVVIPSQPVKRDTILSATYSAMFEDKFGLLSPVSEKAKNDASRMPSMIDHSNYATASGVPKDRSAKTMDLDALDRLIDRADENETKCVMAGMKFGTNDAIRALFPCIGPFAAHFYAADIPDDAALLGVRQPVTEMMHGNARCLCCLSSVLWWPGICIGGCIKRGRLDPAATLRTYRSVLNNPKLYAPRHDDPKAKEAAESPELAAELATLRKYDSGCNGCWEPPCGQI